jgi:hypothetical protein
MAPTLITPPPPLILLRHPPTTHTRGPPHHPHVLTIILLPYTICIVHTCLLAIAWPRSRSPLALSPSLCPLTHGLYNPPPSLAHTRFFSCMHSGCRASSRSSLLHRALMFYTTPPTRHTSHTSLTHPPRPTSHTLHRRCFILASVLDDTYPTFLAGHLYPCSILAGEA